MTKKEAKVLLRVERDLNGCELLALFRQQIEEAKELLVKRQKGWPLGMPRAHYKEKFLKMKELAKDVIFNDITDEDRIRMRASQWENI